MYFLLTVGHQQKARSVSSPESIGMDFYLNIPSVLRRGCQVGELYRIYPEYKTHHIYSLFSSIPLINHLGQLQDSFKYTSDLPTPRILSHFYGKGIPTTKVDLNATIASWEGDHT